MWGQFVVNFLHLSANLTAGTGCAISYLTYLTWRNMVQSVALFACLGWIRNVETKDEYMTFLCRKNLRSFLQPFSFKGTILIGCSNWISISRDSWASLLFNLYWLWDHLGLVTISVISLFFFLLIFKNWSVVNLQCCVSFCCIAKWVSYTYIHSFLDSISI